jgi:hypothetical protein
LADFSFKRWRGPDQHHLGAFEVAADRLQGGKTMNEEECYLERLLAGAGVLEEGNKGRLVSVLLQELCGSQRVHSIYASALAGRIRAVEVRVLPFCVCVELC